MVILYAVLIVLLVLFVSFIIAHFCSYGTAFVWNKLPDDFVEILKSSGKKNGYGTHLISIFPEHQGKYYFASVNDLAGAIIWLNGSSRYGNRKFITVIRFSPAYNQLMSLYKELPLFLP